MRIRIAWRFLSVKKPVASADPRNICYTNRQKIRTENTIWRILEKGEIERNCFEIKVEKVRIELLNSVRFVFSVRLLPTLGAVLCEILTEIFLLFAFARRVLTKRRWCSRSLRTEKGLLKSVSESRMIRSDCNFAHPSSRRRPWHTDRQLRIGFCIQVKWEPTWQWRSLREKRDRPRANASESIIRAIVMSVILLRPSTGNLRRIKRSRKKKIDSQDNSFLSDAADLTLNANWKSLGGYVSEINFVFTLLYPLSVKHYLALFPSNNFKFVNCRQIVSNHKINNIIQTLYKKCNYMLIT